MSNPKREALLSGEEESFECALPDGGGVNFYQIIPLYDEELEYKLQHDAHALLDLMDDGDMEYVKLTRRVVTRG